MDQNRIRNSDYLAEIVSSESVQIAPLEVVTKRTYRFVDKSWTRRYM